MREYQERRRLKKFLHSRYAIAVLAIVCLLVTRGVWGAYGKYEKSKAISERMAADLSALEARQDSLNAQITSLGTPEGKEREIRDRFGAVKDGEKMIVLLDTTASTTDANAGPKEGWWSRFWGFLGL